MASQETDPPLPHQGTWLSQGNIGQPRSGLAAIALCVALLAIACGSSFFVIAEQEMSPNAIALNRLLVAAVGFGIWNGYQFLNQSPEDREKLTAQHSIRLQDWLLLGVAAASFVAFLILLAWSLTQTTVAKASLFTHMMPIFTTLGAWLLLGRRFSPQFLAGMVVAVLGAIAIGLDDLSLADGSVMGDGAALLAAAFFAVDILAVEQLRVRLPTPIITLGECTLGTVLVLPTVLLQNAAVFPPSWRSGTAVLGLALITQMLGHGLLTYSLRQISAGLVSVATLAIPIIAAVLAMVLFSQTISQFNSVAFVTVLIGIYLAVSASKET